jgi:tRNA 2-thiocytidine biosynthesis protein TtcA
MSADPERLARWLLKSVNRALREYAMIRPGDRVAVAVSGGKDSLALLYLLQLHQRRSVPVYHLAAVHVQGDARGPATPAHPPLTAWLAERGIDWRLVPPRLDPAEPLPLDCQRCARSRRRTLFEAALDLGCNVVALGHHADDLAETTLLNLIFHGRAETMPPVRTYFDGRLRLIRPLCHLPERALRHLTGAAGCPVPPPPCPRAGHSRRELARSLLAQAQGVHRQARVNLLRAGLRGLASGGEGGVS